MTKMVVASTARQATHVPNQSCRLQIVNLVSPLPPLASMHRPRGALQQLLGHLGELVLPTNKARGRRGQIRQLVLEGPLARRGCRRPRPSKARPLPPGANALDLLMGPRGAGDAQPRQRGVKRGNVAGPLQAHVGEEEGQQPEQLPKLSPN